MRSSRSASRGYVLPWVVTWTVPAALQLLLASIFSGAAMAGSPTILFSLVVTAAGLCVVTSTAVLIRAHRRDEAELAYIGLFSLTVSVLPLVHGLTTPGVLYGANTATTAAVQWSVPLALILASPALLPPRRARRLALAWRRWAAAGIAMTLLPAALLLLEPNLLPTIGNGSRAAALASTATFAGCVLLSRRHLYLAQVADSAQPLIVSVGFGFVGASTLVWFGAQQFSVGFWVAHGLDVTGVFAGSIGALVALRSTNRVRAVVEPILTIEPLAALELGLDPIVHRFVEDLEAKDPITRDHVIRTAELAMEIGVEVGLTGPVLRQVGLTALLHDIGKLDIPDVILNKPARLSADEYEVMKKHAAFGQSLVEQSPALADIGPLIRAHHERMDGLGYPDRRTGQAIPYVARIVAVCDSFDAMANTRQYRDGMGAERALAVLREHAGSQWDTTVVEAAGRVIERRDELDSTGRFDTIGRAPTAGQRSVGCDCLPAELSNALIESTQ